MTWDELAEWESMTDAMIAAEMQAIMPIAGGGVTIAGDIVTLAPAVADQSDPIPEDWTLFLFASVNGGTPVEAGSVSRLNNLLLSTYFWETTRLDDVAASPGDPDARPPIPGIPAYRRTQRIQFFGRAASPWTQRQYRLTPQFFDRCHYRIPVRIILEQILLSDSSQDYNPPRVIREHGFDLRRAGAGTVFEPIGTLTSQALRLKSVTRI